MDERPKNIEIRGARVHNLKNIDLDIPLNKLVGIAGVSGSGKSSLALGILYSEGSRRYLESLSTYTRRRMTTASEADVDSIEYIPAALALHQRPAVPGIRSTFGTSSELLNSLRLMISRLGVHRCPNGHEVPPSPNIALMKPLVCPVCHVSFTGPSAESFAFNSEGACRRCQGTGITQEIDESTLIPNQDLTLEQGACAPWNSLMWSLMVDVCRAMGVRTDVPFKDLTPAEKEIVYHGPAIKKHILYRPKSGEATELDFTYYSAVHTVENALAKVKDETGMKRVSKFLKQGVCPACHGSRLCPRALSSTLGGKRLDEICAMPLKEAIAWVKKIPQQMPADMKSMAESIVSTFLHTSERLMELGLGYLSLDRSSNTLSTGERQRIQLARAVRARSTGILYVLDEPTIGLHPSNVDGMMDLVNDLTESGNSVVLVDHDTRVLKRAEYLIEMGPKAGDGGGRCIAQGTVEQVEKDPSSIIGPYISGAKRVRGRERVPASEIFRFGSIDMETSAIHTVKPLRVSFPRGRLISVTGVSGSGKTTLILESLIPALKSKIANAPLPSHVKFIKCNNISKANLIDATPIGANVRSTIATYCGVLDDLRQAFAKTDDAKKLKKKMGDFSYNTGSLRCPTCDGTGQISMDVQFLPDVSITCPDCKGSRYAPLAYKIRKTTADGSTISLPEILSMTVDTAIEKLRGLRSIQDKLKTMSSIGLGYLTLGEATPALSGGEAQRLKLSSEMGHSQQDSVFVFDEPTIGLHPQDVQTLIQVFQRLIEQGATVIVIEHDLDMISNSDYIIDMGPQGGIDGGRIVAQGTPEQIAESPESITGRYLKNLI